MWCCQCTRVAIVVSRRCITILDYTIPVARWTLAVTNYRLVSGCQRYPHWIACWMLLAHDDRHILDWHIEHQAWANASDMSWSKQRPLVAAEDVELGLVDSRPVTLENTPCISRVGVPAPIGVADA